VNKLKTLKGAVLVAATSMLPLSQAAMAEVSISGWINEGVTYADDGEDTALYQTSENGYTLGSRITFAGSSEVATGINAGFELIIEPQSTSELLGGGSGDRGANGFFGKKSVGGPEDFLASVGAPGNGHDLTILGNSLFVSGAWGKVTVGLQSMPTDNIAVLEDPSLTLWSAISPVFVGNAATIRGAGGVSTGAAWGSFLTCGSGIGGIGID
jgi:predicted porin